MPLLTLTHTVSGPPLTIMFSVSPLIMSSTVLVLPPTSSSRSNRWAEEEQEVDPPRYALKVDPFRPQPYSVAHVDPI
ncbi:hypothetical protein PAAG_11500 [Paracoccidioides lutzii Pb01]|uniref:Uncharacterized protein n=1 Tax=Paracoccidioides lutzii (strain ATCC MYA-826 / Pb01) TaxID=502779 RepID=A0A0A2V617_PARBA|nr:hypothetical protein PAAG_11500 [Paracoccidioides lutzii Pb01]KGQ01777.1 hypothetical protein PAAG_11500 [Paracoccidioides lutzii Pb01]